MVYITTHLIRALDIILLLHFIKDLTFYFILVLSNLVTTFQTLNTVGGREGWRSRDPFNSNVGNIRNLRASNEGEASGGSGQQ